MDVLLDGFLEVFFEVLFSSMPSRDKKATAGQKAAVSKD